MAIIADSTPGNRVLQSVVKAVGRDRSVYVRKAIPTPGRNETLVLSYRFQVVTSTHDSAFLGVFFQEFAPGAGQALGPATRAGGGQLGSEPLGTTLQAPNGTAWHEAIVEIDGGTRIQGRVKVDGTPLYSGLVETAGPNFGVHLGAIYLNNKPSTSDVRYDDVLVQRIRR